MNIIDALHSGKRVRLRGTDYREYSELLYVESTGFSHGGLSVSPSEVMSNRWELLKDEPERISITKTELIEAVNDVLELISYENSLAYASIRHSLEQRLLTRLGSKE